MAEPAPHTEPIDKNIVDRAIETISKVLSYSFALSIVVTIYDVVARRAVSSRLRCGSTTSSPRRSRWPS